MNKYSVTEEILKYKDKYPAYDIINCWRQLYFSKVPKLLDDDLIVLVETLLIFYKDISRENKIIFTSLIEDFKNGKIGKYGLFNNIYYLFE